MESTSLGERINSHAPSPVLQIQSIGTGHGAKLFTVQLKDGSRWVAKQGTTHTSLDCEGWMLEYLAKHSRLTVPAVLISEPDLLVMQELWQPINGPVEENMADQLAATHKVVAAAFGLEKETLIGSLRQPNIESADWISFFAEQRVLYMARHAVKEGRLPKSDLHAVESFLKRLPDLLPANSQPCLLHGDLWGGNVVTVEGGLAGFIDPAIYYGDREIEIAFTTLFGGFSQRFYDRYQEHLPLDQDFWQTRKDVYNLYPLLVHVRLFGASYVQSVRAILNKYR